VVSNYTQTLDLIAIHCQEKSYPVIRLDGSVSIKKRQEMVLQFNDLKQNEWTQFDRSQSTCSVRSRLESGYRQAGCSPGKAKQIKMPWSTRLLPSNMSRGSNPKAILQVD